MPAGDVWGNSWLSSWGVSWRTAVTPPAPEPQATGGGGRGRRRGRVIRYSDFESREELERAMRVVLAPVVVPEPIPIEDDEDDDVVANLLMMMH